MPNYKRLGPESKCPACGWTLDPDAYRCPKCFIYFCFKCRKRVQKGDAQFQCVNQTCDCHGKLLCAACTAMVPEFRDVTRKIPHPGQSGLGVMVLVFAGILGVSFGSIAMSFPFGLGVALAGLVVGAFILKMRRRPFMDRPTTYTSQTNSEQIAEHRCCIQCKTPVEALR